AYLGPEKTFTEKAAQELFPDDELVAMQPIRKVILAVENGEVEAGVVPIENFYNGEVRETLDTLSECSKTNIVKEKAMKIVLCLGALKNHGKISKILSKDQAIEQSSRYLSENYPNAQAIAVPSTAEAVNIIKNEKMSDGAAIASEKALAEGGLEFLDRDICPNNKTRFVVLSRQKAKKTGDDKTFLALHPPVSDKPGVLHNSLGVFAGLNINLELIMSRPDGKKAYFFYIELDGHEDDENVKMAINSLKLSLDPEKKFPDTVKILGSYPNSHWKDEEN
ncbi:MAG: prephenate dehydratase domain-containing protein, partial [archaeon]